MNLYRETESHSPSRDIPAPLSSISSIGYGVPSPIDQNPDPVQERVFEEKTILLNFRKPVIHHSIMDKSFKEIFRAILTHAMECSFAECRLDSGEYFLRPSPSFTEIIALLILLSKKNLFEKTRSQETPNLHCKTSCE